jgi:hypothetical protein
MEMYPYIDTSVIKDYESQAIHFALSGKKAFPHKIEIDVLGSERSKSSINFNVLPGKSVKEDIIVKKYILKERSIEAIFDRKYYSEMAQSPDHLIFLSTLVHLQKMIYIYLCYEFGLSMKLEENEKLKIWPINLSQIIKIKNLRKTGSKTYFGKCESSIDNIVTISADALIYKI